MIPQIQTNHHKEEKELMVVIRIWIIPHPDENMRKVTIRTLTRVHPENLDTIPIQTKVHRERIGKLKVTQIPI